jgi:hypothetical protein
MQSKYVIDLLSYASAVIKLLIIINVRFILQNGALVSAVSFVMPVEN